MSRHLKSIIEKNNQLAAIQVVFVDVEKYSKRRTSNQVSVINEFTNCLQQALKEIGQEFIDFMQKNDLNFRTDIIILPTGDGAAVNFTFEGLHNIHVKFSETLLKYVDAHNQSSAKCEKFDANGWCNCHNKFNVRIGIDEGKAIIYKDINDNYNVAGNPINMAARLLGEANRNQIVLSEDAYKQIIDLEENPNYEEQFLEVEDVKIKHGLDINIYILQSDKEYINNELADSHIRSQEIGRIGERLNGMGLNFGFDLSKDPENMMQAENTMHELGNIMGDLFGLIRSGLDENQKPKKIINVASKDSKSVEDNNSEKPE